MAGGRGAQFAPPFPRFLNAPGFWDEATFADVRLDRLFTVLFTDESGKPIRTVGELVEWRPDGMVFRHVGDGLVVEEFRCVLDCQAFCSEFVKLQGPTVRAFVWSLQESREPGFGTPWRSATEAHPTEDSIEFTFETRWPESLHADRTAVESENFAAKGAMGAGLALSLSLGADAPRGSFTLNLAQRHDDSPLYETSVLPEKWRRNRLAEEVRTDVGVDREGFLHLVQSYELESKLVVACGVGLDPDQARSARTTALAMPLREASRESWRRYFASVPQFECDDPFLEKAYWYRWYGLRLGTVDVPGLPIAGKAGSFAPFVTEGIGFFRNFITYSAQAHLREVAWMHDPRLATGILDNLERVQADDGHFPGHNYSCRPSRDFYHADFATGYERLSRIHPAAASPSHLDTFARYREYFDTHRRDPSGAYLIFDQNETGQEYMNRYLFASKTADKWDSFRILGVDATTYIVLLARLLGEPCDALATLFSKQDGLFLDRKPDGEASPSRPATCFYPLLLPEMPVSSEQASAMARQWLLNPELFWLPACFPAESPFEPTFRAEPEWRDKRTNCPWNGRSWPMVNSHLVDALANVARRADPSLREPAAQALMKSVRLLFHDGDPNRPCCYEHYNPIDGTPALYRGYDDYMHSWVVDLILRHAVGVLPNEAPIEGDQALPSHWRLDPLPLGVALECSEIPHPDGRLRVSVAASGSTSWELS